LEGEQADVICAMRAAGWNPADPVTLRSSARIAGDVLARRAYPTAPVSDLLYDGRRQDLAFQKPSGVSPSRRHPVRFWKALNKGETGWRRPTTAASGSATTPARSPTTWCPTSMSSGICLQAISLPPAMSPRPIPSVASARPCSPQRRQRPYFTEGEIAMARLRPGCESDTGAPTALESPPAVTAKKAACGWVARLWRSLL
jgi:hypothetical protein